MPNLAQFCPTNRDFDLKTCQIGHVSIFQGETWPLRRSRARKARAGHTVRQGPCHCNTRAAVAPITPVSQADGNPILGPPPVTERTPDLIAELGGDADHDHDNHLPDLIEEEALAPHLKLHQLRRRAGIDTHWGCTHLTCRTPGGPPSQHTLNTQRAAAFCGPDGVGHSAWHPRSTLHPLHLPASLRATQTPCT